VNTRADASGRVEISRAEKLRKPSALLLPSLRAGRAALAERQARRALFVGERRGRTGGPAEAQSVDIGIMSSSLRLRQAPNRPLGRHWIVWGKAKKPEQLRAPTSESR